MTRYETDREIGRKKWACEELTPRNLISQNDQLISGDWPKARVYCTFTVTFTGGEKESPLGAG